MMRRIKTYRDLEKAWDVLENEISSQKAFEINTEEAKKERRDKARNDEMYFAKTYFPEYFESEWAPFHYEWPVLARKKENPQLIVAMRGGGKSTFFNFLDTIYCVCFGLSHYTVLGGYSDDRAKLFSARVLLELLYNPRLESDFGQFFKTKQKPATDFFIAESKLYNSQTVIQSISIGQSCRGLVWGPHRPDRAVLDDIQTSKRSASPKFVNEVLNWIFTDFIPCLKANYEMLILATYLHSKCVASILCHGGTVLDQEFNPVSTNEFPVQKNGDLEGKPTWPAMFPLTRLKKLLKVMGTRNYQQELNCRPKSLDGETFSEEWIKDYKSSSFTNSNYTLSVTWIDPATTTMKKEACKKAVITVGLCGKELHVRKAWIRSLSINKMMDAVFKQALDCGSLLVIYEDNGGQALLRTIFDNEFEKRGITLPIKPHTEHSNKLQRIEETLSTDMENGYILFDKNEGDQKELITQLIQFPNGLLDGPDALTGAVKTIKELMKRNISLVRTGKKRTASTWKGRY